MRIILIICFILGLLAFLQYQFPYAIQDEPDRMQLTYMIVLLSVVLAAGGVGAFTRSQAAKTFQQGAAWLAIFVVLVLGYSFRDRITGELLPNRLQESGGMLSVRAGEDGHFHIEAQVNGVPVNFMVDTGASNVVLSPRDAQRAGFDVKNLSYTRAYHTANGIGRGADITIGTLVVGSITLHDLPASVNEAEMDGSLLGMSFLKQLKSYSVDGNTLTLVP